MGREVPPHRPERGVQAAQGRKIELRRPGPRHRRPPGRHAEPRRRAAHPHLQRVVRLGTRAEGRVAVLTDLAEGEEVIAAPPAALRDGARVN